MVQCTCVCRGPEAWATHVPTAARGLSLRGWLGGGGPVRRSTSTEAGRLVTGRRWQAEGCAVATLASRESVCVWGEWVEGGG